LLPSTAPSRLAGRIQWGFGAGGAGDPPLGGAGEKLAVGRLSEIDPPEGEAVPDTVDAEPFESEEVPDREAANPFGAFAGLVMIRVWGRTRVVAMTSARWGTEIPEVPYQRAEPSRTEPQGASAP
jgi:hypothetical protein